jgi:hypothetical protein
MGGWVLDMVVVEMERLLNQGPGMVFSIMDQSSAP